ncbi:MAG: putative transcriptional regulatory protein KdpE [Candidatus Xenobia bacterium]
MTRVLVVDDEKAILRFLRTSLGAHGYKVLEASTGEHALEQAALERPEVILLDLTLPDIDGVEVTRRLREWSRVPIIVVSVRGSEADKIEALDAGANDYLTKPFGLGELMARMRVALRSRLGDSPEPVFRYEGLEVDLSRRLVSVDGVAVRLTPTEYDLLKTLIVHAGKVLTHRMLLREVWGRGYEEDNHLVRANICNLRAKLERDPTRSRFIQTEPGVGYRLKA